MKTPSAFPDPAPTWDFFLQSLLQEQQALTAVEKFSQRHDHGLFHHERRHRDLIPLTSPREGEQYAFEVDLDRCSSCKACVTACHSLNGLGEAESWRSVGLLIGKKADLPFQQTITTTCHHCVDPACLNGCPVNAYDKDPATGIVRHLDDQCIGCQYCILKCPYDVPQYDAGRGIVRKCDMCHNRLANGEAPACVQACPTSAIRIAIVRKEDAILSSVCPEDFLPGAPHPATTQPTTRYLSQYPIPSAATSANHHETKPEPAHAPLVVMLALTQLAAGAFVFDAFITPFLTGGVLSRVSHLLWPAALTTLLAGLATSVFHLGRPMKAWRFFLGLRHSWLSREILAFSILGVVATLETWQRLTGSNAHGLILHVIVGVAAAGAIFSSHMIYHDTRRESWMGMRSAGRFFGTAFILGAAFWLLGLTLVASSGFVIPGLALLLMTATAWKLLWEKTLWRHHRDAERTPLGRSALLMRTTFRRVATMRFLLGCVGGVLLPAVLLAGRMALFCAAAALVLLLTGELLERYLYFRTAVAPRMPGGIGG